MPPTDDVKKVDLVFEGGGIKGIALVGAYSVLEEQGYRPQNMAGTSAGAIVAVLLAAGYSAAELKQITLDFDFTRLMDEGPEDKIPIVGAPLSILLDQGIYEGKYLVTQMEQHLRAKGVRTFGDLVRPESGSDLLRRYAVQIIASDLTERRLLVLPRDARLLGVEPDALEVSHAVRMSMSIPIVFEPVRHRDPATRKEHLIVDGGLLSNYPVWIFDPHGVPSRPTFGMRMVEDDKTSTVGDRVPEPEQVLNSFLGPLARLQTVSFILSMAMTMMEAHDRLYIETSDFARTIPIPSLGVGSAQFDLSRERRQALYESGRKAAEEFLQTWDFEGWKAAYLNKDVSRRDKVARDMTRAARQK